MLAKLATIAFILISQLQGGGSFKDAVASLFSGHVPQEQIVSAREIKGPVAVEEPELVGLLECDTEKLGKGLSAGAVYVMDSETGEVIFQKDGSEERAPASLVKLMTAYLVFKEASLGDTVRVSAAAASQEPANIELETGEVFTVNDLLSAILIKSANDAAYALGEHVGGGDMSVFVDKMNAEAERIGLNSTFYANSTGLDAKGQKSSARDVAILLNLLNRNEIFRKISPVREREISSFGGRSVNLKASNKLLERSSYQIVSGKTGFTDLAGQSLAVIAEVGGRKVIAVVMGSNDRFGEVEQLLSEVDNYCE